jgi:hypothetical protein
MATEFKVGDRVRYIPCKGEGPSGSWQNVTITRLEPTGGYWGDDDNEGWRDGLFYDGQIELIDPATSGNKVGTGSEATDELAELRAFKETALAAGYVPPEPPKLETDEEAAKRFCEEWWKEMHDDVEEAILAAIAWARANPRQT